MDDTTPQPAQGNLVELAHDGRLAELRAELAGVERGSGRLSTLRGATFLGALVLGLWAAFGGAPVTVAYVAGAVGVLFIGLVVAHAAVVTRSTALERRVGFVELAMARLRGEFAELPERGERFKIPDHPYAGDLDVFGRSSLFQLLDTAQTGVGEATLAAWLSAPAAGDVVAARQVAVRELAALPRLREDLAVLGMDAGLKGRDVEPVLAWAEAVPAAGASRRWRALARAALVLVPITVGLFIAGQVLDPARVGLLRHAWLLPVGLQMLALLLLRPTLEPILSVVSSRETPFGRYRALLELLERQPFEAPILRRLQAQLSGEGAAKASDEMRSLERIVSFAELRHSGLVAVLANALLLWDVWSALALDRWRERTGSRARAWTEALGEAEALSSLGAFSHDHPAFAFPEIGDGSLRFEAVGIGHPLLPEDRRVVNDVALTGPGKAMLVTGSNMSGKSTLLRSLGVNAVLALAGAPVCAQRLVMSPVHVRTSMRIDDSLERSVSHFYAELLRLKLVVDAVDRGEPVLFLLDEILHGTNSRERQIGARAVVRHIIDRGAIGAVSSHDLGLAGLAEESEGRVSLEHFEELVEDGKMTFDYKLKPGLVRTANALRLMKIVGIAVDLPES